MDKRPVRIAIAICTLLVLLYLVNIGELWGALRHLTLLAFLYLMAISVLLIYISVLKWQYFLEALGDRVSARYLFALYLMGYFVNLIVPSYVGGDAVRSYYAGKKVGQHEAFASTILERYTGLVAMLILAVGALGFASLVTWEMKIAIICCFLGMIAITALALSPRVLTHLERIRILAQSVKHLEKVRAGLNLARKNIPLLGKALSLSFLYHLFTVLNTMAAAYAVGWCEVPLGELLVVLPIILLIGAIPISPSGLGIQEGAFYYFLHGIGASPAQALGVAVVLRAKSFVLALFGWLVWLRVSHRSRIPSVR